MLGGLRAKRLYIQNMKGETLDPYWHRARIAARIWLKAQQGKPLSPRDKRLARMLADQRGVSNRLIEQARAYWVAPWKLDENRKLVPHLRHVLVT
jgi:hypothetical protein